TTTYLNFSEPDALRKLAEYPNIETRVYQGSMHAKGYFFKQGEINTVIIGSANITQSALTSNKEWNILFHSFSDGDIYQAARAEFDALWNAPETAFVHELWIAEYERYLNQDDRPKGTRKKAFSYDVSGEDDDPAIQNYREPGGLKPNAMQCAALGSLKKLHEQDASRALLISATGTGKTYLSAFDVEQVNPKRVLFVAHSARILNASEKSYRTVLGPRYTYGVYGGQRKQSDKTCLFAMIITLANNLAKFSRDEFDYIVIDEAHRSGADSYQKIIDYFQPRFLLGMTATPLRTDGYDLFELYNHTFAYRITLYDALKNDMLAPFHYFGIADLNIDGEEADDLSLFAKLTSEARVAHIIDKIEAYSVSKRGR
ncbi:MAG: DEAD/DEAH box helicase family protein, partial [Gordonibacter sp.]